MSVTSISLNDSLEAAAEGLTHIYDVVLLHVIPFLVHRVLEGLHIGMADPTGIALHLPPDGVI